MTGKEPAVSFTTLRRCAPGRFAEEITKALAQGLKVEGFRVAVKSVELGENPFVEEVTVRFAVDRLEGKGDAPESCGTLVYTFTNETSVDQNVEALREFIQGRWDDAAKSPEVVRRFTFGHTGD